MVAALALATTFGCEWTHICTLIGCGHSWSLTLRKADGSPPAHTVELDVDGTRVVCPAVSPGARHASCASSVTIQLADEVVCEDHASDDSQSQVCTPTGRFEEIVSVNGTPAEVVVALNEGGTVTDERTFVPRYQTTQPNGPECSPTCRQGSDHWDLP